MSKPIKVIVVVAIRCFNGLQLNFSLLKNEKKFLYFPNYKISCSTEDLRMSSCSCLPLLYTDSTISPPCATARRRYLPCDFDYGYDYGHYYGYDHEYDYDYKYDYDYDRDFDCDYDYECDYNYAYDYEFLQH